MRRITFLALGCAIPPILGFLLLVALHRDQPELPEPVSVPAATTASALPEPPSRPDVCPECRGSGAVPVFVPDPRDPRGFRVERYEPCPACVTKTTPP
jgi:hypothetical protein